MGADVRTGAARRDDLLSGQFDPVPVFGPVDLVGLALFVGGGGWAVAASLVSGGQPGPMAVMFFGCGLAFAASRAASAVMPVLAPVVVAVFAAGLALSAPRETFSGGPLTGPLGYANAKSALFVQAAAATLVIAAVVRDTWIRAAAILGSVVFALVPWASGTAAAAAPTLLLPAAWLVGRRHPRSWPVVAAAAFLLLLGSTVLLAIAPPSPESRLGGALDRTLTRTRLELWHEAAVLIAAEPIAGLGPGRFQDISPTARSDPDDRWAHHEFLQQGAETGVIGFVLLVALFLWGFVRLAQAGGPARTVPIISVALLALGGHASVDYVLHFPEVSLAASALLGVPGVRSR